MEKIIEQGAVISEYPPGTQPDARYFPRRNSLISAFSRKILVVEAAEGSGALITGQYGLEMNREVLAVPNNIYSTASKGCNELIYNGAKIYIIFSLELREIISVNGGIYHIQDNCS